MRFAETNIIMYLQAKAIKKFNYKIYSSYYLVTSIQSFLFAYGKLYCHSICIYMFLRIKINLSKNCKMLKIFEQNDAQSAL